MIAFLENLLLNFIGAAIIFLLFFVWVYWKDRQITKEIEERERLWRR